MTSYFLAQFKKKYLRENQLELGNNKINIWKKLKQSILYKIRI